MSPVYAHEAQCKHVDLEARNWWQEINVYHPQISRFHEPWGKPVLITRTTSISLSTFQVYTKSWVSFLDGAPICEKDWLLRCNLSPCEEYGLRCEKCTFLQRISTFWICPHISCWSAQGRYFFDMQTLSIFDSVKHTDSRLLLLPRFMFTIWLSFE